LNNFILAGCSYFLDIFGYFDFGEEYIPLYLSVVVVSAVK